MLKVTLEIFLFTRTGLFFCGLEMSFVVCGLAQTLWTLRL